MLGFTLAEISEVLAVWVDDEFTAEQKQASLRRKLQQLEEKEAALIELRARLKNAINKVGQPCVDAFQSAGERRPQKNAALYIRQPVQASVPSRNLTPYSRPETHRVNSQ
nr:MerR family DNA-binding protein [Enterobacter mori]